MSLDPSPTTGRKSDAQKLEDLKDALGEVQERNQSGLEDDLLLYGLNDLAEVWEGLDEAEPDDFLNQFQELNPRLDLENLDRENSNLVVLGILRVLSREPL